MNMSASIGEAQGRTKHAVGGRAEKLHKPRLQVFSTALYVMPEQPPDHVEQKKVISTMIVNYQMHSNRDMCFY